MSIASFHFAAIPRRHWADLNPGGLGFLAAEALSSERRLEKEINLTTENARYSQLCRRLEGEAFRLSDLLWSDDISEFRSDLQAARCTLLAAGAGYIEILWAALLNPAWDRFGRSFFTPTQIETHQHAFDLWTRQHSLENHPAVVARKAVLEVLAIHQAGLLEVQLSGLPSNGSVSFGAYQPLSSPSVSQVSISDSVVPASLANTSGKLEAQLRAQISEALRNGSPVCFGNQAPHDTITESLHAFVYAQKRGDIPPRVRIAYADGSEAQSFPVHCLSRSASVKADKVIRIALLSMRHLSLDTEVDFCWFRNREVSRAWALAEADAFCYRETRRQLAEMTGSAIIHMILYHTGFEPACVGFYRGLVDHLYERRVRGEHSNICVEPRFFRGSRYQAGSLWT